MSQATASLAAFLLAAVLLSGCSEGPPAEDPVLGPDGNPVADGVLALPTWSVGDWWSYLVEVGPGEEGAATTYVITEDKGSDWWMDTDSPERAFQDARDDISRLGAQRKSDLAGSQGDDRIEFFHWPLAANDTWTTRWDGNDVTIQVETVEADGATLTARNATHLMYTYRYDADAGWFGQLDRHGPDGAVAFSLFLYQHGSAWGGTAVRWTLETLLSIEEAPAPVNLGAQASPTIEVPAGTTDLWLTYLIPCAANGGYSVDLRPRDAPQAGGYAASGPCQGDVAFAGVAVTSPAPGPWVLALTYGSSPVPTGLSYTLLGRTLSEVPVEA